MQTDLFEPIFDKHKNLLPQDGVVHYYGKILCAEQADDYLRTLLASIEWRNDVAILFGKKIITQRKVAWYGDQAFKYRYSNSTKVALPWTKTLLELKHIAERESQERYNSCLLNLYHSGEEGMAWHSDGEVDLKKNGAIASMSLGAERTFLFKHKKSKEKIALYLQHGSLMIMKDTTQTHWLHRLPPSKKVTHPRVNLTFRTIKD